MYSIRNSVRQCSKAAERQSKRRELDDRSLGRQEADYLPGTSDVGAAKSQQKNFQLPALASSPPTKNGNVPSWMLFVGCFIIR